MSLKRRRAINIDAAIIEALKAEAKKLNLKSHTTLAVAILLGEKERIHFTGDWSGKTLGVSMRESIWLSMKHRSQTDGLLVSDLMTRMILGTAPALTPEDISKGEGMAAEREAKRALEAPTSKAKKKAKKKPEKKEESKLEPIPAPAPVFIDYEKEEAEERRKRHEKLPKGSSVDPPKKPDQKLHVNQGEEEDQHLGGIFSL